MAAILVVVAVCFVAEAGAEDRYAGRTQAEAITEAKGSLSALLVSFSGVGMTAKNVIAMRRLFDYGTWRAARSRCGKRPAWRVSFTQTRSQYERARLAAARSFPQMADDVQPYSSKPESWYLSRKGLELTCN